MKIYTAAGTDYVTLYLPNYVQDVLIVSCSSMLVSSLIFLGRETFCISKVAKTLNSPAHVIFGRERTAIILAMLINLVAVFSSLGGLGLSLVDLISVKTSVCQEMITQEAVCGSLPPSLSGLPVCITVALV